MIVPDEIAQLVAGSGNNFHAKVARWLQADGWHVVVSPYYMDQTQNKAREIDLVAEKAWPIKDVWGTQIGDVIVRIFVECKFIPSHSVFWFADKDIESAEKLVCSRGVFRLGNMYTDKHHYLSQSKRVAKLFATAASKSQELEPYYKALNQVLNAMVSMRGGPVSDPSNARKGRGPRVVLELPMVVCSSFEKLYQVDFYADSPPQRISENFQLELRYAYHERDGFQRDEYLLVDFVEFNQLDRLMQSIGKDAEAAAYLASPN
jgi:hypothetical protein